MSETPQNAGIIAPPPVLAVPFLVGGIVLRFVANVEIFGDAWVGHAVGWPVMVVSFGLVGWAFRSFHRAGEHADVREPTGSIVTAGPYGYSRNPMYVALSLGFVALALVANTYWFLIVLAPLLVVIQLAVIRKEERYLEGLFGEEYQAYRSRVRRWI